jgi:hypothetical protein
MHSFIPPAMLAPACALKNLTSIRAQCRGQSYSSMFAPGWQSYL